MIKITSNKIQSDKGIYIGDPCYVFNRDTWNSIVDRMFHGENVESPMNIEVKNDKGDDISLIYHPTMYGDGVYSDQDINGYPVDSGTLGVVPLEFIEKDEGLAHGSVHDYTGPVKLEYDNGVFTINLEDRTEDIVINTK